MKDKTQQLSSREHLSLFTFLLEINSRAVFRTKIYIFHEDKETEKNTKYACVN